MKANSHVFYKGNSRITGRPIVGIITSLMNGSRNQKTGEMYQVYIFVDNGIHPFENTKTGADCDVCGNCQRRPYLIEAGQSDLEFPCYMGKEMGRAISSVWNSYQAGKIKSISRLDLLAAIRYFRRSIRISTYGDPTAIPLKVWQPMIKAAAGHTGYTQFWADKKNAKYISYFQASVSDLKQQAAARKLGWNTFRSDDSATNADLSTKAGRRRFLIGREIPCPNPLSKGRERLPITCAQCLQCSGLTANTDVLVASH